MLLFTDGFASMGRGSAATAAPSGVMGRRYSTAASSQTQRPRNRGDGRYLYHTDGFTINTGSTHATKIVGFEWLQDENAGDGYLMLFREGAATGSHASLLINREGYLEVRGPGAVAVLGTGTTRIRINHWHQIETKLTVHQSTGAVEVRLNGQVEISVSGVDTQNTSGAFAQYVQFMPQDPVGQSRGLANLYVMDGSGSLNNDFIGGAKIATLTPNGDGATNDWTPSSGSDNYLMLDELATNSSDSDTSYVSAVTSGDRELYGYTDLPGSGDLTLFGITAVVDVRVDSASPESICQVANSNGAISVLPSKSITAQTYSRRSDILELDPDTSAPWTREAIDGLEFGFEID